MALTKAVAQIQEWSTVGQNVVAKSSIEDISGCYAAILHIETALDSTVAHTGTEFIIQVSANSTDNEDWTNLTSFVGPTGTANTENIVNNPLSSGSTTIILTDTSGYTTNGSWRLIKDATIADSELVYQTTFAASTSIGILDGTKNAHAQNTPTWSIAQNYLVDIPFAALRTRVIVNNAYDPDGASCVYKVRLTKVTAV